MKKGIAVSILSLVLSAMAIPSWADDTSSGQSTMSIDNAKDKKNAVPGSEEADAILTNNKLRAETGSLSRWSVATSLEYVGGSISHPFADYRPNIQNVNGQSPVSDIDGGINVKYNFDARDSIWLGETVRFITPQTSLNAVPTDPVTHKPYRGQKVDSYNPGLTFQRLYTFAGIQSYFQTGPNMITQTDYTRIGYLGNWNMYNVNAIQLGHSKFTAGLESGVVYAWFRSPQNYPEAGCDINCVKSNSTDVNPFVYPYLEYAINDKINLRTVGMWFSVEHTLSNTGDYTRWTKDVAMQSVGVGISVTRDFFLYPNVQFIPDQTRGKQTNVALSSNINLF